MPLFNHNSISLLLKSFCPLLPSLSDRRETVFNTGLSQGRGCIHSLIQRGKMTFCFLTSNALVSIMFLNPKCQLCICHAAFMSPKELFIWQLQMKTGVNFTMHVLIKKKKKKHNYCQVISHFWSSLYFIFKSWLLEWFCYILDPPLDHQLLVR